MNNHVEHFFKTGELLKGTYYFDPPLIDVEIEALYHILMSVNKSKVILYPLSFDLQKTGNYNNSRTLLWLEVYNNTIHGWQNIDETDNEDGQGLYTLKDFNSINRWCQQNDCLMPFRDGRLFLIDQLNTEDIFNQLNESEDFDWVDTSTDNLSGQRLYDLIQNYFREYTNNKYWLDYDYDYGYEDDVVHISDDTGTYYDIAIDNFTIPELIRMFKNSLASIIDPKVKVEYIQLAKVLEPIIGQITL